MCVLILWETVTMSVSYFLKMFKHYRVLVLEFTLNKVHAVYMKYKKSNLDPCFYWSIKHNT